MRRDDILISLLIKSCSPLVRPKLAFLIVVPSICRFCNCSNRLENLQCWIFDCNVANRSGLLSDFRHRVGEFQDLSESFAENGVIRHFGKMNLRKWVQAKPLASRNPFECSQDLRRPFAVSSQSLHNPFPVWLRDGKWNFLDETFWSWEEMTCKYETIPMKSFHPNRWNNLWW